MTRPLDQFTMSAALEALWEINFDAARELIRHYRISSHQFARLRATAEEIRLMDQHLKSIHIKSSRL